MLSLRRPHARASTAGLAATLTAAAMLLVGAGAVAPASAAEVYYPSGTLTLTGHGNGHGKGMSQYGAYGMAAAGKTYEQILDFYYPVTDKDTTTADPNHVLRVDLAVDDGVNTMVELLPGATIHVSAANWQPPHNEVTEPTAVPFNISAGNPQHIQYLVAARYTDAPSLQRLYYSTVEDPTAFKPYMVAGHQFASTNPIRFQNTDANGTVRVVFGWGWSADGKTMTSISAADYHGYVEAYATGSDTPVSGTHLGVYTINGVTLEDYLPGVVPREMPANWTPGGRLDALEAQAVAARTYAIVQSRGGYAYDMFDDTRSQMYRGVQWYDIHGPTSMHEETNSTAAVRATAGEIRTYNNNPISAMFSSSNGGYTVAVPGYPYLDAHADPYDAYNNPNSTWTTNLSTSAIASAYAVGTLKSITVNSRDGNGQWGGRVQSLTISGTTKSVTVTGDAFRSKFGLRSMWWTTGTAPGAPAAVSATGGNGYATVSWAPPSSDGGKAITGYTVRTSAGGPTIAASSAARSVTVPSLTNGTTYTFTVTATNAVGTSAGASDTAKPVLVTSSFHTAGPVRVFDSRASHTTLGAHTVRQVKVAGVGGIPSGVTGVALNVTVTNTTATSFLTVYAKTHARPTASNVNWSAGQTVPNLVEVPVAPDGTIELYNEAGRADVIIDVFGYYDAATAANPGDVLHAATPRRIFDTRNGVGGPRAKLGAGQSRTLTVAGANGVPATATAVVTNLTATNVSAPSFLTAWPVGQSRPHTSALNMVRGQTRANAVVLPLGTGGKLAVYNDKGSADVIVDVLGWYVPGTVGSDAGQFAPIQPSRLLDTRNTIGGHRGKLGRGAMSLQVTGRGGVPSSGVGAVALNVTAVGPSTATFVTVYPAGAARPYTSNLNAPARATVANMVIVPVGSGGKINLYNDAGSTDLVVDVLGWYSS